MPRPKRQELDFDTEGLAKDLEQSSKGKGVDALFPEQSPTLPEKEPAVKKAPAENEKGGAQTRKDARIHAPAHASEDELVEARTDARMRALMEEELRNEAHPEKLGSRTAARCF